MSSHLLQDLSVIEIQRRQRISQANKGKVPWNLGRKHSEGATTHLLTARQHASHVQPCVRCL